MILSKIRRSLCNGSYKNIIDTICYTFGCDKNEVMITEVGAMKVKLENVPISSIIKAGFSTSQAVQIIKSLLPVGVSIETIMFDGTFEFAETENEYDEAAGFSESENGTIGGYLGWANTEASIDTLPI